MHSIILLHFFVVNKTTENAANLGSDFVNFCLWIKKIAYRVRS